MALQPKYALVFAGARKQYGFSLASDRELRFQKSRVLKDFSKGMWCKKRLELCCTACRYSSGCR